MHQIEVDRDQLKETLTKNQITHTADFEIAWEAFRKKAIENAVAMVDALKNLPKGSQQVNLHIGLQVPQNHSDDYQRALEMLEWELNDKVTLTEHEFQELVQDDWGWKQGFETSNQLYTGSPSPSTARRR